MLQVKLDEVGKISLHEVERPRPKEGEVLIKVVSVGICGSDMHVYQGHNPVVKPPLVQGHEFGGTILEIGSGVPELVPGMIVAVNPVINCGVCRYCTEDMTHMCEGGQAVMGAQSTGAMTEEIVVPAENVVVLNNHFNPLYAPFIEPTAVAVHTADRFRESTVAIIGLGPIGLLCQEVCRINGNRVIGFDVTDIALQCSQQLGADKTFSMRSDDLREQLEAYLQDGLIDCVIDTVCSASTLQFAVDIVRRSGEIKMVGIPAKNFEVDVIGLLINEVVLSTSYLYTNDDFIKARNYVTSGQIQYEPIVTRIFPMREAAAAYAFKSTQPSLKVLLAND